MNSLDDSLDVRNRDNPCPNTANDSVLVILDVRNITHRQSTDYTNTTVDYSKLLADVVGNGRCVKAVAVDGVQYNDKGKDFCKSFHDYLWNCGFTIDLIEASNNKGKQEGVDIEIALIAQRYALLGKCDVVELITGDGDFGVLVKALKFLGVRVNVTSFYRSLSYSLKEQADSVTILDDEPVIKMQPKNLGVA